MPKLWAPLVALLLANPALQAAAQNYPTKPIRMVVPFAPGGTGEFLSRSITPRMGELIGQQFIVDFRGGAGTTLAAGFVPLVTDNNELNKALDDSAVRSRLLTHGATIKSGTPAQAAELLTSEIEKWEKVVKATGARVA